MELRHIRYFLAVAEELNFTRAAEKLMIAQPPLSRQIQDLENELDTKLFIRSPRALQLTEEGILFKQQARQILDLVEKSTEEVREMKKGLSGMICIASVEGHGPRQISQWIAGFHKEYPNVQYSIWNGNSDDVIDRLQKGLCDLAVIVEPYNPEGLYALRVHKEPWIAMIPADHPLVEETGDKLPMAKLAGENLILPSRKSRLDEIHHWFQGIDPEPRICCEMAHMMNAYELTEHGVGIAIYPATAAMMAQNGKVVVKELVDPAPIATYSLIWSKNRQLSHVTETFLKYVQCEISANVG